MLKPSAAVCVIVSVLAQLSRAAGGELIDEVRAGNRAALESIQTLHCVVTKSILITSVGRPRTVTGEYWSSGSSRRARIGYNGGFSDSVVNDSVARSLFPFHDREGNEHIRFSIMRMEPGQPHGECDPWKDGLLKLCGPKGWPRTLEELLTNPHELKSVDRRSADENDFIVVGLSLEVPPDQHGDFEIWFDPRVNYLASKLTGRWAPQSLVRRESKVVSFKEVLPAVYFPERAETRFYDADKLTYHDVVVFSEFEINRPIPADTFVMSVPPGAKVYDYIEGIEYQVDSRGERVGAARPTPKFEPLPAGAKQMTASTEEPRPWSRSIFLWSLALFVIGGAVWFIRRVRQANVA